ncbi:MAG: RNA polymerase sigma factor [Kineosporiaceae bacterium]
MTPQTADRPPETASSGPAPSTRPDGPAGPLGAPTRRPWTPDDVLDRAMAGDAEALRQLVTDAHPHVQRFARHLCATEHDAADAAQEALVVLFRKVGTLRAAGALTGWMFRVVARECLRRSRPLREHLAVGADLRASLADGLPGLLAAPVADDDTERAVLQRLEAERVADAIAALPPLQRRVLVLRDIRGLPGHDVAAELGIGLAAMKSQLHRARIALRTLLADA